MTSDESAGSFVAPGSRKRTSERPPHGGPGGILRAAPLALLLGAAGSVGATVYTGRGNKSLLLMALFVIWVLSPFIALLRASARARRRESSLQTALCGLILVVVLGSLSIYGQAVFGPPRAKPASTFLVIPLVSWLLIATVLPAAGFFSRRRSDGGSRA
ncbi:MAG: hypothetical protein LC772_12195 [Chloroflexi bacterium]|nr:hypothetical protein [Chloroflexota bacterium]